MKTNKCLRCDGEGGEPMQSVPFEADDWRICPVCNGSGLSTPATASEKGRQFANDEADFIDQKLAAHASETNL